MLDLAEVAALYGSGPLLLRIAVAVLDLHKLGTRRNFTVDVGVYLDVKARGVKALAALHVRKQSRVESAAAGAGRASSGRRVERGVFLVEWRIGKGEVKIVLNPRA